MVNSKLTGEFQAPGWVTCAPICDRPAVWKS